jgi:hypothetical protein
MEIPSNVTIIKPVLVTGKCFASAVVALTDQEPRSDRIVPYVCETKGAILQTPNKILFGDCPADLAKYLLTPYILAHVKLIDSNGFSVKLKPSHVLITEVEQTFREDCYNVTIEFEYIELE